MRRRNDLGKTIDKSFQVYSITSRPFFTEAVAIHVPSNSVQVSPTFHTLSNPSSPLLFGDEHPSRRECYLMVALIGVYVMARGAKPLYLYLLEILYLLEDE